MILDAHALAETLPPLLISARKIAGAVMGCHGRRRSGPGDSFWQFRPARPGDSVRLIDWRQSARGDHLQVRETEWAAAQTFHIWCDPAPSLHWHSIPDLPDKSQRAMLLSLSLALLLLKAGERVSALGSFEAITGERRLETLALHLARCDQPRSSSLAPGHGVILISDFLKPMEHWTEVLKALSARGVRGHLIQVLDPAELDFPYQGRIIFAGLENQPELPVNRAQEMKAAYQGRMADHCAQLSQTALSLGWSSLLHRTDHGPETALLALYARLAERAA